MWVTVEPGNLCEGRFEAAQIDAVYSVWRWQVGASMGEGPQRSGTALTHERAWSEAMMAVEDAKRAEAVTTARAEGEAAGRAAERERVLALVRAAYDAAREVERRCEILDPSAASGVLDVLEQRIERGDVEGA